MTTNDINDVLFEPLIGLELSSVEFVMDYLQLRFGGPFLTIMTDPTIEFGSLQFDRQNDQFCNMLCKRIGATIVRAFVREYEEMRIEFNDGASVVISLRPADYIAAEAVIFDDRAASKWWVW